MRGALISTPAILLASAAALSAQARPDFSGAWRPVVVVSGGQSQDVVSTQGDLRIEQNASTFTVFHPPDGSSKSVYRLDGSESRNGDEVARASWVGSTIVIDAMVGDLKIKTREVFSLDSTGRLVVESTAAPPLGDGSPTRVIARKVAAQGSAGAPPTSPEGALAEGFVPPQGFIVDQKTSKTYDFSHEPISYPKKGGGGSANVEPEGRTWSVHMNVTPPNKTSDATDATMRESLKAQGWEIYTTSGTLVAHRVDSRKREEWFKGAAFSGDYRATIIEVGPPPHAITLTPPAAAVETVSDTSDFPYLQRFPGSTLKKTTPRPTATLDATAPGGAREQLVGPPVVEKDYDLPPNLSTYEFMVVYREALASAGWTVLRTAAGSDALVVAHYARNGRDLYCYLHDGTFLVADVGAASDAQKLADALARDGHVAVYGIYFDVDQSTLKPESEAALAHIDALLTADSTLVLEVQGHTDNTGSAPHNQTLSEARAASVKTWLVAHGIAAGRLTPRGYGDTQPIGDNKTPEGRARNRRVELRKQTAEP